MTFNRRDFLQLTAASAAMASLASCAGANRLGSKSKSIGRVVVVGGGYAGATAAKYLRMWSGGSIEVVVIEPNPYFISCPLSNLVLGGNKRIGDMTFTYDALKNNHGIQWVHDAVTAIDPATYKITMARGELSYDRLVVAPGIDFIYDQLPMLQSAEAQTQIPHAWKAGPQTVNLYQQLKVMPDDGVFVISIPQAPYRCPPGPYERVSQVAFYFKNNKPKAKIIVLDANAEITSKKGLFTKAWSELYPGMVDYRANSKVVDVDVPKRIVKTEFETVKADVLNIIPPQRAGKPAQIAGVVNIDKRWCGVDFLTYQSQVMPDIHIIGDSVSAGLPKSAHMATSQAKVCANAIVAIMSNSAPDAAPVFANTCYSFVSDKMAMHVAHVYRYDLARKIMLPAEGGGVSDKPTEQEGNDAQAWARNIWSDTLT
ncbi:MAG TPA: NAD(P)/FAD-dependent oxidoreductase [Methylophilaceae bacterium]|nr:NAD(P)/FAD-dependent oxidoreductase [Methylophilaceae bacterium]